MQDPGTRNFTAEARRTQSRKKLVSLFLCALGASAVNSEGTVTREGGFCILNFSILKGGIGPHEHS